MTIAEFLIGGVVFFAGLALIDYLTPKRPPRF